MKKRIVLCADDYGQAPGISRAIIELLEQGRLSAVSCMVNADTWPAYANWLLPFKGRADIGLHFNLTEGRPLSEKFRQKYANQLFSLNKLMMRSASRLLDQEVIEAECEAQIQSFQDALGFLPDFVDGHQHVQQFPVVREALLAVYQQQLASAKSYIRLVNPAIQVIDLIKDIKKVVIRLMGGQAFSELLDKAGIPHNTSFSGIYRFCEKAAYSSIFPIFLQEINENGIIMCHPGSLSPEEADVIAADRAREYAYLSGEQFVKDCEQADVQIGRFNAVY